MIKVISVRVNEDTVSIGIRFCLALRAGKEYRNEQNY